MTTTTPLTPQQRCRQRPGQARRSLRSTFTKLLNAAITNGTLPACHTELGHRTLSSIEAIARDHPEAAVGLIAEAYDAFIREHGFAEPYGDA